MAYEGYGAVHGASSADLFSPYGQLDGEEELATLWVGNALPGTTDAELAVAFKPFGTLLTCFLLQKLSPNGQLSGFVRYATRDEADMALQVVNHGHITCNGATVTAKWADKNSKPSIGQAKQNLESALLGNADVQIQSARQAQALQVAPSLYAMGEGDAPVTGGLYSGSQRSAAPLPQVVQSPEPVDPNDPIATLWVGNVLSGTTDAEMVVTFSTYGQLLACFLLKKASPNGQLSGFVRYTSYEEAETALRAIEAGMVVINGMKLIGKWATRNTGVTKALFDAATQA
jgi:RNA recognition motif-containing protein